MRVILVGRSEERRRLRAGMPAGVDIVGEAGSAASARRLLQEVEADAIVTAAYTPEQFQGNELEEPLTPRELEVLALLSEGLSNKMIAARLSISDQTVKFHVASIGGKLNALNRTDAVRQAVRRGLISL